MKWFNQVWLFITRIWKRPGRAPTVAAVYAAGLIPEPEPLPEPTLSRAQRRSKANWERQRRKFDKWVTPEGPQPVKRTRPAAAPKPPSIKIEPVELAPEPDGLICVDVHHSDGKTKVLYEEREFIGEFN